MDPSSKPEETPLDEPADTPADVPDYTQSPSSQAQDEPRVIVEHLVSTSNQPQTPQELPSPGDLPSPENLPTPSYTFDIQSALAAERLSPVAEDEEEDLYTDDRESFKTASESGRQSSSPERVIESMAPRRPRPPKPIWQSAKRSRSAGGLLEYIFVKNSN
ncbi:hypothetical protein BBO_03252 [Beauveria brongniartii RCEF 3172]|uniref:Uncharacterized protein n=1 Tax=Beauveria brongniartii RCEF 3172 TaxID=1081107 RepID=A0A167GJ63_9HYPO|nr:hypothetical protein BBO_03252 [Beauveria brongniartii RCEF 3172]